MLNDFFALSRLMKSKQVDVISSLALSTVSASEMACTVFRSASTLSKLAAMAGVLLSARTSRTTSRVPVNFGSGDALRSLCVRRSTMVFESSAAKPARSASEIRRSRWCDTPRRTHDLRRADPVTEVAPVGDGRERGEGRWPRAWSHGAHANAASAPDNRRLWNLAQNGAENPCRTLYRPYRVVSGHDLTALHRWCILVGLS